jgi:GDP-fucose protein O-fucosyltransferase
VAAVRAKSKDGGTFDAFHVRRGDFQYKSTRVEAHVLVEMAQRNIPNGTLLYMATDEKNKAFFEPLKQYYDVVFLDDFHDEALNGVNTNFYGMIDQLVATRSRTFFGCWFSTYVQSKSVCDFGIWTNILNCISFLPLDSLDTSTVCVGIMQMRKNNQVTRTAL